MATVTVAATPGGTPSINIERDFAPGSHKRFAERVGAAQQADYQIVLDAYDSRADAHPDDVAGKIERCRFIEIFAYAEDVLADAASEDLDSCREELLSGNHADDPAVVLYGIETGWGEENVAAAQELIPASRSWEPRQQAELHELLSDRLQFTDPRQAGWYATQAVNLDPASRLLLRAAEHLVSMGAKERARRLLANAPAGAWENVPRSSAAKMLLELGDTDAAAFILRSGAENEDQLALARLLEIEGDLAGARTAFKEYLGGGVYLTRSARVEYFNFERRHGSKEDAVAAYEALRATGFAADPLARQRLALLISHPGAAWHWRDALGLLTLVAALAATCLVPLLIIMPVHYRGLARQLAGRPPGVDQTRWQLGHAWYALTALVLPGFVAVYVFTPSLLEAMGPWNTVGIAEPASDRQLANAAIASGLASLVLLLPLVRTRSLKSMLLGRWSLLRTVLIALGLALLLRLLVGLTTLTFQSAGALGSDTTRIIQGLNEHYGLWAMLFVVAIIAPVVEELIFRGVLLEAFRARVSFWFAVLVQALAFVLLHEEWQSMPYLLVFAVLAGWLVRRSEGLLAPMIMHGVNNVFACLLIAGATGVVNQS